MRLWQYIKSRWPLSWRSSLRRQEALFNDCSLQLIAAVSDCKRHQKIASDAKAAEEKALAEMLKFQKRLSDAVDFNMDRGGLTRRAISEMTQIVQDHMKHVVVWATVPESAYFINAKGAAMMAPPSIDRIEVPLLELRFAFNVAIHPKVPVELLAADLVRHFTKDLERQILGLFRSQSFLGRDS